ncbi:MAG: hypothetical protein H0U08_02720 [Actinobacteria bacterium]|nr:hypothetical protein [Actinomycetota bacterium]
MDACGGGSSGGAATALGAALRERTGIQAWPVVRMAFQSTVDALDDGGPEVDAARYEGRRMSPRDALSRLVVHRD